jgi:hypothetical protein
VSGGGCDQFERSNRRIFPPVELDDLLCGNTPFLEVGADPERYRESNSLGRERANDPRVEMVVVVVRDHDHIDDWEIRKSNRHRM